MFGDEIVRPTSATTGSPPPPEVVDVEAEAQAEVAGAEAVSSAVAAGGEAEVRDDDGAACSGSNSLIISSSRNAAPIAASLVLCAPSNYEQTQRYGFHRNNNRVRLQTETKFDNSLRISSALTQRNRSQKNEQNEPQDFDEIAADLVRDEQQLPSRDVM
jgi:hypothetical protein